MLWWLRASVRRARDAAGRVCASLCCAAGGAQAALTPSVTIDALFQGPATRVWGVWVASGALLALAGVLAGRWRWQLLGITLMVPPLLVFTVVLATVSPQGRAYGLFLGALACRLVDQAVVDARHRRAAVSLVRQVSDVTEESRRRRRSS